MTDWSRMPAWDEPRVARVASVSLSVEPYDWPRAAAAREAIDANWARALARNPAYFNGIVHLARRAALADGAFSATLFPTDFKTYLHWRESSFCDRQVRDVFGSALIRSEEGHVILGRQRAGNVNAGLTYLPGGFIDVRDVIEDAASGARSIDIEASILREAIEELGLLREDLDVRPGYYVTATGHQVSVAIELASHLPAREIEARFKSHISADPNSELTDIVIVKEKRDFEALAMPSFVGPLLGALFP